MIHRLHLLLELEIMNKKKRSFRAIGTLGVFLFVLSVSLFAVDTEVVNRYLTAANDQYSAGNYAKAYTYINNVLSLYGSEKLPQNVDVLSESIYYGYLEDLKKTKDWAAFANLKAKLIEYPYLSSERIARSVRVLNTQETEAAAWGYGGASSSLGLGTDSGTASAGSSSGTTSSSAAGAAAIYNNQLKSNILEFQLALEKLKAEAQDETLQKEDARQRELLETQRQGYERALEDARVRSTDWNKLVVLVFVVLAGLVLIVLIIVVINFFLNLKGSKSQDEKFVETLKAVAEMSQAVAAQSRVGLQALPPLLYEANTEVKMIGSAMKETGLPPPPVTEAEKKEMADLAHKCRELGAQIDAVTGRKNNSQNVAELVFKLAQEMGVGQYEATLFFSVAMVYDIGFLDVDPSILKAETLSEAQKYEIRNHVKQGLASLSFVPEKYMAVFVDGVLMHHENIDGTGYPEGLEGARIPFIARLIRVAESFVALVSRRNYRAIYDKESAVADLRAKPGLYDGEIVTILEAII